MTSAQEKNIELMTEVFAQYLREYCKEYLMSNKRTNKKVEYICDFVESAVYNLTGKTSEQYAMESLDKIMGLRGHK